MRKLFFLFTIIISGIKLSAQPLPFGTVYGKKPDHTGLVTAGNLEHFMGNRKSIKVTLSGMIKQVTKAKGGWFDVDAGQGRIITAHFRNIGISLPLNLKNRYIIMEGVAQKQISPDGRQIQGPKQFMLFEVSGLEVRK